MDFIDEGVILGARPHGETHAVAEILTPSRGRWAGLVYGGQGRKAQALLQTGNEVRAEWKGRLDDSLGHFTLELTRARAAELMHDRLSLAALSAACAVASATLPEREAHGSVYRAMKVLLGSLDDPDVWPSLMARFELGLLAELGFGLSLDRCAATGAREDLIYVSPRSAAAVSREAGAPYHEKLLPLPAFLREAGAETSLDDALDGLATTGHFIETRVLHIAGRELPESRAALPDLLRKRMAHV